MRIVAPDGRELPRDEIGELHVRGAKHHARLLPALPASATGKVLKAKLRELAQR